MTRPALLPAALLMASLVAAGDAAAQSAPRIFCNGQVRLDSVTVDAWPHEHTWHATISRAAPGNASGAVIVFDPPAPLRLAGPRWVIVPGPGSSVSFPVATADLRRQRPPSLPTAEDIAARLRFRC